MWVVVRPLFTSKPLRHQLPSGQTMGSTWFCLQLRTHLAHGKREFMLFYFALFLVFRVIALACMHLHVEKHRECPPLSAASTGWASMLPYLDTGGSGGRALSSAPHTRSRPTIIPTKWRRKKLIFGITHSDVFKKGSHSKILYLFSRGLRYMYGKVIYLKNIWKNCAFRILHISKKLVNLTLIEEGFIQKRRQRSSLLLWGQNLFNSLPR